MPPTSNSRNCSLPHFSHFSMKMLPWISESLSRAIPDRRCNPSTFWLTTSLAYPAPTSAASAICVVVGTAWSKSAEGGGGLPAFSAVQTPFGPRKSATPALVLIPAPVRNTVFPPDSLAALMSSATCQRSEESTPPQMLRLTHRYLPLSSVARMQSSKRKRKMKRKRKRKRKWERKRKEDAGAGVDASQRHNTQT